MAPGAESVSLPSESRKEKAEGESSVWSSSHVFVICSFITSWSILNLHL